MTAERAFRLGASSSIHPLRAQIAARQDATRILVLPSALNRRAAALTLQAEALAAPTVRDATPQPFATRRLTPSGSHLMTA